MKIAIAFVIGANFGAFLAALLQAIKGDDWIE